jgi:hypothetical protein
MTKWCALFSVSLLACGKSHSARPDASQIPGDGTNDGTTQASVEIDIDHSPVLVAFRDGLDQPWQAATMMSPTRYTIDVHGPYVVAVVTDDSTDPTSHYYSTRWTAQTPGDDHTINILTGAASSGSHVTGQMVQPGRVFLGQDYDYSSDPNWAITLTGAPGPHDFFAFSADHALVRRAIDTTHDLDLGMLDVNASGSLLEQLAFTATNATANETLTARSAITTATTPFASITSFGPANTVAVMPYSALASGDVQTVSVGATKADGYGRYLRKSYHTGGDTAYTLPTNFLSGATWTAAADMTFGWTAVASTFTTFQASVNAAQSPNYYEISVSPRFVSATGVDHVLYDTQLPGYQSAWKVDLSQGYYLSAMVQNVDGDLIETATYDTQVGVMMRTQGSSRWDMVRGRKPEALRPR